MYCWRASASSSISFSIEKMEFGYMLDHVTVSNLLCKHALVELMNWSVVM